MPGFGPVTFLPVAGVPAGGVQAGEVNTDRLYTRVSYSAPAPEVNANRLYMRASYSSIAARFDVSRLYLRTSYNVPAKSVKASRLYVRIAYRADNDPPRLRANGWSLDGHDFYQLTLGDAKGTLIYDITSGTWANYVTEGLGFWRPVYSVNWQGVTKKAQGAGMTTDVVMGDSFRGLLWTQDPVLGKDEGDAEDKADTTIYCKVQGNLNIHTNNTARISRVYLYGSLWTPYVSPATISLSMSDDQGRTFSTPSDATIPSDRTNIQVMWRSLGAMQQPGRIFLFEDTGVSRIDGVDIMSDKESVLGGE